MEASLIWTIIGVVATIAFGVLSIVLFRKKKYPGKVTLVKHSVISLFNNIAKNFNEINISYKDSPIKENVIYVKCSFINDGELDIDGKMIEQPVKLILNDNLKWIKSIITSSSNELIVSNSIAEEGKSLEFSFGLFRRKEFFQFEALIETENEEYKADDIFDNLEIKHRISNTQKIQQTSILTEEQARKKKSRMKSNGIMAIVQFSALAAVLIAQIYFLKESDLHYQSKTGNELYTAKIKDENVKLIGIDTDDKLVTLEQFGNDYEPLIPEISFWDKLGDSMYVLPFLILMLVLIIGTDYLQLRKTNKIQEILKDNK